MTLLNQDLSGPSTLSSLSTAGLLEKIEFLRSALRWASRLERPEIEKLLRQANALREGRVVSKEQIVNHLYGWGDEVAANAIEVYVYRIRRKLEPLGCEIRTVRGMGYLMERIDGPS